MGLLPQPNGGKRDILIKDLSETGCRFFDKFSGLLPDDGVEIKIEKLGPFCAVVRWSDSGYIGTEFDKPLYGPVFDHIRQRLSQAK